jgi:hypothetical protein
MNSKTKQIRKAGGTRKRKAGTRKAGTRKAGTRKAEGTKKMDVYPNSPVQLKNNLERGVMGVYPHSYSPSINKQLVSLKSIQRTKIAHCNIKNAFLLEDQLKIAVSPTKCSYYYNKDAKQILLNKLRANKHVDISKIIGPKQIDGNCWFNAMFMMFFVSDKGRKFFHFFRQLMILGVQANGKPIPTEIKDSFALLNYAVELSLTGSKYARITDTNYIILDIYDNIPDNYKYKMNRDIPDEGEAGNPILYYSAIMKYLNNNSINILEHFFHPNWKKDLETKIGKNKTPDVIILNVGANSNSSEKPEKFTLKNGAQYALDSLAAINVDSEDKHFCALLTCNKKDMGFDGYTFSRMVPMEWKKYINQDKNWFFEGSTDSLEKPFKWNFMRSYMEMNYYRIL